LGLFRRRKQRTGGLRRASGEDTSHLEEFARTRRGVEAYLEPRTTVTESTVVLVAADGEWTRRRISSPDAARELGRKLAIPVYDTNLVGYPRRMREWTARRKEAGQRKEAGRPGATPGGGAVEDSDLPPLI
jgi:hypothetical protein